MTCSRLWRQWNRLKTISLALILGEVLDCVTTFVALNYLGLVEGNPLVAWVGWWWTIALKVALNVALVWLFERRCYWFYWFFPFMSWYTVCFNIQQMMIMV